MADVTRYNLAQFFFNDEEIRTDSFKTTRKMEAESLTATNSHKPYATMFKKEEFEWEASDIDQVFRKFFEEVMDRQKENPNDLGMVCTYDYNENGDLVQDDIYDGVWIEEISKENANNPFSVKGGARDKIKSSTTTTIQ